MTKTLNAILDDTFDIRDVIARFEELEEIEERDADESEEAEAIEKLLEETKGNGGDEQWRGDWYPVTFIKESYASDYTQELLEDCGDISKDLPAYVAIDWDKTWDNISVDYTSIEIEGDTYYYR